MLSKTLLLILLAAVAACPDPQPRSDPHSDNVVPDEKPGACFATIDKIAVECSCGCRPDESSLMTRVRPLDRQVRTAVLECYRANGDVAVLGVFDASAKLEACVDKKVTLDTSTRDAVIEIAKTASLDDNEYSEDWRRCYRKCTGIGENQNPDPDQDRILGSSDKCPDVPEDYNGFEDSDGCPDAARDNRNACQKGNAANPTECRQRCLELCSRKRGGSAEGNFCSESGEGWKACVNGDPGVDCPRCNDAAFVSQ